ncbi:putative protein OS=Streptomyces antimycoticus OX=68175 GN=SANT12839_101450 PE=4 SV=1 [Streptomyces antimycoticus]
MGSKNYTPRQRATCPKTSRPTTTDRSPVSPTRMRPGDEPLTERLQGEVWWLHRACPRRLAYALRPLITIGWTWQGLAAELHLGSSRLPEGPGRLRAARAGPTRQRLGADLDRDPAEVPVRRPAPARGHAAQPGRAVPDWQRYAQQLRPYCADGSPLSGSPSLASGTRQWNTGRGCVEERRSSPACLPVRSWDEDISGALASVAVPARLRVRGTASSPPRPALAGVWLEALA